MSDEIESTHQQSWMELIRQRTPARIYTGRVGGAYLTSTQLQLRQDHAAARDAVQAELALDPAFCEAHQLFEVRTQATSKAEYLLRPDRGRMLTESARERIRIGCHRCEVQVIIGDGLSATAVATQVPQMLPLLTDNGLSWGQPFVIRYARVGVLNELGPLIDADVFVLLIGERPGLATAESLSAYMAYRPQAQHTDAQRNLLSNIHARGVTPEAAVRRIIALIRQMQHHRSSGIAIKEEAGMHEELAP